MSDIFARIQETVDNNPVVLFMKGSKDMPQCGFSAATSHVLSQLLEDFVDIDVLRDPELRQGIKEFSDWPTIPQLYVKGEFLGGCDIVKEMYETGELQELLKSNGLV